MEWKMEKDEEGNTIAEGKHGGVRVVLWLHPDEKNVRVEARTSHSTVGVWVPVAMLASVLPSIPNRDCHNLRNAAQVLDAASSDAEVLAAGYEVKRRIQQMRGGGS